MRKSLLAVCVVAAWVCAFGVSAAGNGKVLDLNLAPKATTLQFWLMY